MPLSGEKTMQPNSLTLALVLSFSACGPALADPIADFYHGKQIQFVIRTGVGGGYDQYSRLLARHIGAHIPGDPTVLPVNMPGGGGIVSANYVANIAPKDGTILTMVSQGLPTDQALGLNKSLRADLRTFNWIGNMSTSNQVLVVWHTSKTQTLDDARRRETVIGTTGAGSISVQLPALYNNVLGMKLKIIFGYPDEGVNPAMEREEVEGRGTNTWASYKSFTPQYVSQKLIIPILQVGMKKDPELPDVPLMRDQAKNPQDQEILDYMSRAVSVGRPVATTPGVPADRVAALRKAFDDTLKDPDFIRDAATERAEISPMSGAELAQVVAGLINAPQDLRDRVKDAIEPRDAQEFEGGKKSGGD
jgi:tripartite-type tricarboxylate transporter receptor subunit TctC